MKSLIRKILLGEVAIQEYSTITVPGNIKEQVLLETVNMTIDVSVTHWLLCLEPIVFGIWLKDDGQLADQIEKKGCSLYFGNSGDASFKKVKRRAVAVVVAEYVDKVQEPDGTLYLLRLRKSRIYHFNAVKTWLLFYKYYKKPKFSFKKYKSLIAAYSYPRRVRLISFNREEYFNIFPMDLLGQIAGSGKYVFGLRHTNVALAEIIETKKIVVSEVPYLFKDIIYQLGKHHRGAPSVDELPFKITQTEKFEFFIPEWADSYKEIRILETRNLGSHMMLLGEITNEKILKKSSGNLFHIHFFLFHRQKLRKESYPLV